MLQRCPQGFLVLWDIFAGSFPRLSRSLDLISLLLSSHILVLRLSLVRQLKVSSQVWSLDLTLTLCLECLKVGINLLSPNLWP
jgi:hypothetical protein